MKRSSILMLIGSALLVAGILIAGCTQSSTTTSSSFRYHNRVGDGKRTGSGRNAVRVTPMAGETNGYCTLRDAPGRDDEQHRALGNHAVGHTAGRDDERHSSLWCCTLG